MVFILKKKSKLTEKTYLKTEALTRPSVAKYLLCFFKPDLPIQIERLDWIYSSFLPTAWISNCSKKPFSIKMFLYHTRPRRPGFKGHPIEFMIILDPHFGPLGTHLNPFGPIWIHWDLFYPISTN